MILISRRKDYYDYVVSIFGRDELKVYNRRKDVTSDEIDFTDTVKWRNHNIYDLIIANRLYRVEQVSKGVWELHKFHTKNTDYRGERRHYRESQVDGLKDFEYYIPRPSNLTPDSPIAIKGTYHRGWNLEGSTPILSTFGIPTVLSAEEIYSEVDMYLGWLMSEKENASKQDDKNKLLSKGFDDKVSFRHRK